MILALSLGACLAEDAPQIAEVVALELDRTVELSLAEGHRSNFSGVVVECEGAVVHLRYEGAALRRARELDLSHVSSKARARTVALAVVELLDGPDAGRPPRTQPTDEPKPIRKVVARAEAHARPNLSVLGTTRIFPTTADITAGARLRSALLARQKGRLLLGVGAEAGRALRETGGVQISAAFGELGLSREMLALAMMTLAAEATVQGGYVVLTGKPSSESGVLGHRLSTGWAELRLGLVPTLQLSSTIGLTSRAALGFIMLGPAATSDGRGLNVWRGVSLTADLGLLVAL